MKCPKCKKDVDMLKFTTTGVMCRDCHASEWTGTPAVAGAATCSADATPRFQKAYLECLDDTGAITRLEPLYAFAEGMERENQDLRQQMVGLRREIEHQKVRVLAWEKVASPYPPND